MLAKKTKRAVAILMALSLCFGTMGTAAMAVEGEEHTHSTACGYVAAVEGHECGHVHDGACGYVEAVPETPCDKGCTETDDNGNIIHVEGCAYKPAVEGHDCGHVHDETCGYVEAVEGQPCAVETVEALIAALPEPEAVTLENADAIAAARAAYDALAEDLKADVANYAVLTAAEEALAALEEGGEEPAVPEIPEETCTVNYQDTSAGVEYQGSFNEADGVFELVITIKDSAVGNVVFDLSDMMLDTLNSYAADYGYSSYPVLPGDSNIFEIKIVNESGHTYQYKEDSFVLATANAHDYTQSNVLGYDGQLIPEQFVSAICLSPRAMYSGLFGVSGSAKVTVDMLFNIYDYLEQKGYTGDDALTRYVDDQGITPDQMATAGVNGIFTVTEEKLASLKTAHPELVPYVYQKDNGDGTYDIQLKWPEPELAARSYNVFYQDYWSFAFGEEVEQLDPNKNTSFTRNRGIGDYTTDTALYNQANSYLSGALSEDENSFLCKMAWDGPGIGNGYMNYEMSFYMALELEQIDSDVTVNKVDESGNALDGAQFKLYKLDGENKLYYTETEGVVSWQADETAAKVFEGGSFDVNLLFGTYYLTEVSAPSGYDGLSADLEIVVDETAETVNVTNTRQYIPGPSYDYYTVTVNYYDKETGEKIADSYVSPSRLEGSQYDVTAYDAIAIDGYTYDSTSGDGLTGILNSNKVVNVYYVAEETDIDDDDTPTTDLPDEPDEGGETDIPDDNTPTGDLPDLPDEGGEVDIDDGETPTGNLPQTGTMADSTMSTIGMLLLALSVTTAGAAAVLWLKKARG